jgi:nitrogen fixation protein FixH
MTTREITGKHVLIGMVAAFGVIIAVNMTLAFKAVGTFPGLEVKNSYVASQSFDARRAAQDALGWDVAAEIDEGMLKIKIVDSDGAPVEPQTISAMLGRPTIARDDRVLDLQGARGVFLAEVQPEPGAWIIKLNATSASGVEFSKRLELWVR